MIQFKNFQVKSIHELITVTGELLNNGEKNSVCVFQAPTGSGKTLMTGQFIKDVIKENEKVDLCFLWVSIGKGELHIQSKEKLDRFFGGSLTCSLVEDEFNGSRTEIEKNEVVFINWEKMRNKNRKTGEWTNILMKKGEKISFPEVLQNTGNKRKIILIIDESHYGTSTERAKEIKEMISADVILHVSATPSYIPNGLEIAQKKAGYVYVNPSEVIEEGLIKKEVIINEDINVLASDDMTSLEAVIIAAIQKRIELKKSFENAKSNVNPLVLIQIPNADEGNEKLEAVKTILKEHDIDEKNEKLAIWISDYKSDILTVSDIAENDNKIEFLIFKQAIDTGWDCPRAQILVKLREVKSETFEIQTIGRILRMPEQRHYIDDNLNKAYIYTNVDSIIVKKEDYNPNIIKDLKSVLRTDVDARLNISSYYRSRSDYGSLTRQFYDTFEEVAASAFHLSEDSINYEENCKKLEEAGVDLSFQFEPHLLDYNVAVHAGKVDEGFSIDHDREEKAEFKFDDKDIHNLFQSHIRKNLGPFAPKRSLSPARMAIYRFFNKYLGSDHWENEIRNIQVIFLKNLGKFIPIFLDAIEKHKSVHAKIVNEKAVENFIENYELPNELFHNKHTEEVVPFRKYAYSPCYLNIERKNTERSFEEFIDIHPKVSWWWKNGENKREYLGIKYAYEEIVHTFYPDYIFKTNDGKIAIVEVKDENDQEGSTKTKAKAEALYKYVEGENEREDKVGAIIGGITVFHNGRWIINNKEIYNWSKTINNDWSDWVDLDSII